MTTPMYLGYPPANIVDWIRTHSQPASHPETRFTLEGGTVETHNITGALGLQWMIDNGYYEGGYWPKKITQADIGNTVTSIEDWVFEGCQLTSIMIPDSATNIGSSAFNGCFKLTNVTFEGKDRATVQSMTNYSFGLDYASEDGVTIHCTDGDIQVQYEG